MSVRDVLLLARARVRKGWCQGASARRMMGEPTTPDDPTARAWCLMGACYVSHPPDGVTEDARAALRAVALDAQCAFGLSGWNDAPERKKADVLAVISSALENVR